MNTDQAASMFLPESKTSDSHIWGSVKAVNPDGSYQVQLNASSTTTRCSAGCSAGTGDRVLVCIMANGRCVAVARLGGDDAGLLAEETATEHGIASLIGRTAIPNGADLNTYTTVGHYYSNNATQSASIANTPYTGGGFGLVVRCIYKYTTYSIVIQELTATNGTRWWRRTGDGGATWAGWYMELSEKGVPDYPVASNVGNRTGWSWIKWASGLAIAWRIYQYTGMTISTSYGYGYYRNCGSFAFPFAFTYAPVVQIMPFSGTGLLSTSVNDVNEQNFSFFLFSTQTMTDINPDLLCFVAGRWK